MTKGRTDGNKLNLNEFYKATPSLTPFECLPSKPGEKARVNDLNEIHNLSLDPNKPVKGAQRSYGATGQHASAYGDGKYRQQDRALQYGYDQDFGVNAARPGQAYQPYGGLSGELHGGHAPRPPPPPPPRKPAAFESGYQQFIESAYDPAQEQAVRSSRVETALQMPPAYQPAVPPAIAASHPASAKDWSEREMAMASVAKLIVSGTDKRSSLFDAGTEHTVVSKVSPARTPSQEVKEDWTLPSRKDEVHADDARRPRLTILPRTKPPSGAPAVDRTSPKPSIFGAARPREEVLKQRGVEPGWDMEPNAHRPKQQGPHPMPHGNSGHGPFPMGLLSEECGAGGGEHWHVVGKPSAGRARYSLDIEEPHSATGGGGIHSFARAVPRSAAPNTFQGSFAMSADYGRDAWMYKNSYGHRSAPPASDEDEDPMFKRSLPMRQDDLL